MCHKKIKWMLLAVCLFGSTGFDVYAEVPRGCYQVQIVAADMCCKGCVQKVSRQLYAAPGVIEVRANLESRTVVVTVSQKKGATLDQLWQAVVAGKGRPTKLITTDATFTLTSAESPDSRQILPATMSHIVVENLNDEGRTQKIANQLYTTDGIIKVNTGTQENTLFVTSQQAISPWVLISAVTKVQERPIAIQGVYGQLSITWSTNKSDDTNPQAQQFNDGGIER